MTLRRIILFALVATLQLSCQELPTLVDGGQIVASVGDHILSSKEVTSATPSQLTGEDSVDFVERYATRWIERQIKVLEAEQIFTSSVQEIESMVESYRQALLIRKLDQFYIDSSQEMPFSDKDIKDYYNAHTENFILDKPIVMGRILRIPLSYSGTSKLLSLMKSTSKDSRLDLISMNEKYDEFELLEFTTSWINYSEFIAMLPIVRSSGSDVYMKRKGVQSLQDATHTYLFEITSYRSKGYVAPLERVESSIRKTLTNDHHRELIKRQEERLFAAAKENKMVRNYVNIDQRRDSVMGYFPTLIDKKMKNN